ncbi:MAG: hypothetical protein ABR549_19435 [Mycobacteriales bacterium]
MSQLETSYAEQEAVAEDQRRARLRRQPLMLIALLGALVLGIGLVSSIDLRRLRTPQGVALRWTQAATFGDCDDYLRFSTGPEDRARVDLCRDLRAMTQDARQHNIEIGLTVRQVTTRGSTAVVAVDVSRQDEVQHAQIDLRRTDGRWLVLRDATTCAVVLCA